MKKQYMKPSTDFVRINIDEIMMPASPTGFKDIGAGARENDYAWEEEEEEY